ncbi:MAG: hypothetical protein KAR51_01175 [Candidatus Aenigmarchaeota archaeon]|nr:hypothetical protein [Candidatus Aenigmarchaeota archaeon]
MKRTIFVLLSCMIFASILGSNAFAADSPADYQVEGLFDGGSDFFNGIYYRVLDTFGLCNYDTNGNKYLYIRADNAEARCKQNTLAGGNLVFYVILPIFLAFLMFWGIFKKVNLFDDNIQKYMAIALALLIAPLGVYRILFISLMSILTGTTVFLLYIFLFVMMLGWGYKEMYVKGRINVTTGQVHMDEMKHAQNLSQSLDSEIKKTVDRINQINTEILNIVKKDGGDFNKTMKKGGKILTLKNELESLTHHQTLLLAQKKEKNERIHEHFTKLTTS